MRQNDDAPHPAALARKRRETARFVAGLVIAAAGLATVFLFREVYVGFVVALVGAGILPIDKFAEMFKR